MHDHRPQDSFRGFTVDDQKININEREGLVLIPSSIQTLFNAFPPKKTCSYNVLHSTQKQFHRNDVFNVYSWQLSPCLTHDGILMLFQFLLHFFLLHCIKKNCTPEITKISKRTRIT